MKNLKFYIINAIFLISSATLFYSCERDLSSDADFATYPTTGPIFLDSFVGMGADFYFPFVDDGAKPDVFSVDNEEGYESSASIRIDVPSADDPSGNFAGAFFLARDLPRNLTGYDALTFWAKSTTGAPLVVGFGEDLYQVTTTVNLGSAWKQYIIPIPDPSKLFQEEGMMLFSAGTQHNGGLAYSFWLDEIQFEKLGNIGQVRPEIFNGQDLNQSTFNGVTTTVTGLQSTFNLGTGEDITLNVAPSYYSFNTTNPGVASVNELGVVSVFSQGSATISAILNGYGADGSLSLVSNGSLPQAPTPNHNAQDVNSIFSDAYTAATTSNFSPGFGGSTTQTIIAGGAGNQVAIYEDNNFTGIIFDNVIDASSQGFMHVDVFTSSAGTAVEFQIRDIGANGELETDIFTGFPSGDDKDRRFTASGLTVGQWTSIDIPLDGDLSNQKNNLGAIILANGPNFILDNIYFY